MARPRSPLFVERQSYRRRRMMDGARILPVVGFVAVLLPVLWTTGGQMGTGGQAVYIFSLWVVLVAAAALLSGPLRRESARGDTLPAPQASPPPSGPDTPA